MGSEFMHYTIYVGCYGAAGEETLLRLALDPAVPSLTVTAADGSVANPSYLALDGAFLYVVSELPAGQGGVASFAVSDDALRFLGRQTAGDGPCHIYFDPVLERAFVSNYGDGSVSVFSRGPGHALLGEPFVFRHTGGNPAHPRQLGPHAHCVAPTGDGRRIASVDLGADVVVISNAFAQGQGTMVREISRLTMPRGCGPRHIVFGRGGQAYVLTELSNELYFCDYHAGSGSLWAKSAVSTLPAGWTGESQAAALALSPEETWLFASNRGQDSIAVFRLEAGGEPRLRGHVSCGGAWPRDLALSPDGRYLLCANEHSRTVTAFSFDAATGALTPLCALETSAAPACVRFA